MAVTDNCLTRNAWFCGEYLSSRESLILHDLWQHVWVSAVSIVLAVVLAVPLTLLGLRVGWLRALVLGVSGVVYTVPSLALFVLLVPYFGLTSNVPLIIGLVLYAQLLLLRNIYTGLDEVPGEVVDAARGNGFTPARLLLRVRLPLAMPAILAGLRVTSVSTVALLSIGGLLGARGGLGDLLYTGFAATPVAINAQVLTAFVLIVALALVFDALILGAGRLATPWVRQRSR